MATVAFAKLLGDNNLVHYMTTETITLGRQAQTADVVLGDNKNISRLHARISYSRQSSAFELSCLSKNGVFVDGKFIAPAQEPAVLHSRSLIQIGPRLIYFLLPKPTSTTAHSSDDDESHPHGIQIKHSTSAGKKWSRTSRERIRCALMRYGFGRWDRLLEALDDRDYTLENVQVYCCQMVQQLIGSCDDVSLATQLRSILTTAPIVVPDPLKPEPSLADWSSLQKNVKKWATRLVLLHELKQAIDFFGETDLLSEVGTIKGRSLGPGWGHQEDIDLCRGIYHHGFGEFAAILTDPQLCFNGKWAMRQDSKTEEGTEPAVVPVTGDAPNLPEWPQHLALIGRLKRILDLLRVKINKRVRGVSVNSRKRKPTDLEDNGETKRLKSDAAAKKPPGRKPAVSIDASWSRKDQGAFQRGILAMGRPTSWSNFRTANPLLTGRSDAELDAYYTKFIAAVDGALVEIGDEEPSPPVEDVSIIFSYAVAVKIKERIDLFNALQRQVPLREDLQIASPETALIECFPSWSYQQDNHLMLGIVKHGIGNWSAILADPDFSFSQAPTAIPSDSKLLLKRVQQVLAALDLDLDITPLKSKYRPRSSSKTVANGSGVPAAQIPGPIVYDADGVLQLPIQITSSLKLLSLGQLQSGRGFRDGKYRFPVGFETERDYPSLVDVSRRCKYLCQVISSGGPVGSEVAQFRVTCADLPDEPLVADRPTPIWKQIEARLDSKRNTNRKRSTINGMEKFGLNHPVIVTLLDQQSSSTNPSESALPAPEFEAEKPAVEEANQMELESSSIGESDREDEYDDVEDDDDEEDDEGDVLQRERPQAEEDDDDESDSSGIQSDDGDPGPFSDNI